MAHGASEVLLTLAAGALAVQSIAALLTVSHLSRLSVNLIATRRQLRLYDTLLASTHGSIRAGVLRVYKEASVTGFNIVLRHDSGLTLRYPIYDDQVDELVAALRSDTSRTVFRS